MTKFVTQFLLIGGAENFHLEEMEVVLIGFTYYMTILSVGYNTRASHRLSHSIYRITRIMQAM